LIKFKYAILSSIIIIGLVLYVSSKKVPIPTGDAEDFWKFSCGIEVKKFDGYFPYAREIGIYPGQDDWYFYYFQEHHGIHVFKVSKQSLIRETTEVFDLLNQNLVSSVQENIRPEYMDEGNMKRLACLNFEFSGFSARSIH
jgi:hypothetical protein